MKNYFDRETAPAFAALDHVYICVEEPSSGTGDSDSRIFSTAEEAEGHAYYMWNHLTAREKQKTHICTGILRKDDLRDELSSLDPDDYDAPVIDWAAWGSFDGYPGAFDSADELRRDEEKKAARKQAGIEALEAMDE